MPGREERGIVARRAKSSEDRMSDGKFYSINLVVALGEARTGSQLVAGYI